jgi:hypothetical protein
MEFFVVGLTLIVGVFRHVVIGWASGGTVLGMAILSRLSKSSSEKENEVYEDQAASVFAC